MRFPCEPPEYFACRVLRARKFVVEDSLKLVAETSAWRAEMRIGELVGNDAFDILGCTEDELQVRREGTGAGTGARVCARARRARRGRDT